MAGSVVRGGILFHPVRPAEPDAAAAARFADDFAGVAPLLGAWAACRVRGELRRRLEIEDLVQEIGLRAWLRIADFDPQRGTFRQWLFGFANRIWLETLREIGRDPLGGRLRRGGDSQLPAIADTVTTISRRVASDEQQRACRDRLDALDEADRGLLVAVGMEGLTHAEAAQLLGIGEDASRKRWQRLRERLRDDHVLRAIVD